MSAVDYSQVGPAVGLPFPDFELPDSDGQRTRFHDWRAQRRALMIFFRSAAW